jgi:hypothetical protein
MESVNGSKNREREMKRKKEDENKKGFWEKGAPGKNFLEKILWIEKLSLCLQCLNIAAKV